MSPRATHRRVVGMHLNLDSYRNHTHRYAQLLWEETLSDGTTRVVRGRPHYEHDLHPVLTPLFGVLCEVWRHVVPELEQADAAEGRTEGP